MNDDITDILDDLKNKIEYLEILKSECRIACKQEKELISFKRELYILSFWKITK